MPSSRVSPPGREAGNSPDDRQVEVPGADASQRLGLLELLEADRHVGMLLLEASQCRREERVAGRQEGPDPQRAALQPGDRAELVLGRRHVAQDRFGVTQQPGTGVGGADWARAAVDERQPEFPLERGDVVRHDRLGVTEL